jgi:3-oxoadipate enol-lactonase
MSSFTSKGRDLAYLDTGGDGIPLVLLHGWPLSSRMWEPQIEVFGEALRVVAPDLKGFGASDAPEDPKSYSMDGYADDVAALLDELGLQEVVLGGLSMGGYVCFAFLRRHEGRARALVLADTRATPDTTEGARVRSAQQDQIAQQGPAPLADSLIGTLLSESTRAQKPDVVGRVRKLMDQPAPGYIGGLEAMKTRPDSSPDLTRIAIPTLVVVGEEDLVTPPEMARSLHEHIGGSRLAVIPGAGHLSNLEAPQAFNGALAGFLPTI